MNYSNPLGQPNPFLITPPIVIVVRHVRKTQAGEIVAENANNLPRFIRRVDQPRTWPHQMIAAPPERNYPAQMAKKKAY